jgi:archaellum component FlaF (FlaF/FlaG flagellin family)
LGIYYFRQQTEQSELLASLTQAQQNLIEYTSKYTTQEFEAQKKDLETRIDKASSRLAALQGEFESSLLESIGISESLYATANQANVTITNLSSSLPEEYEIIVPRDGESTEDTEEEPIIIPCRIFALHVAAEGEVMALLNFLDKLNQLFPTGVIDSVTIDVREEATEDEAMATMHLELKIYIYEAG